MNWYVTIAGFVCAFTTIGHFLIGSKEFLKPMLAASFDSVPKKVMHCVFHYVSSFLILSTIALLFIGFGIIKGEGTSILSRFISINYAFFAIWQIALAITSKIPKGIFRLFQWIFFITISIFAWIGT